jgi:hypothetical protein
VIYAVTGCHEGRISSWHLWFSDDAQDGVDVSHLAYLTSLVVSHLSPFALCAVLPRSPGGRDSADYYEDSITLGLAPP